MLKQQSNFHKWLTSNVKATACLSQANDWLHQSYSPSLTCKHLTKLQSFTSNSDQPAIHSIFHSSMLCACVLFFACSQLSCRPWVYVEEVQIWPAILKPQSTLHQQQTSNIKDSLSKATDLQYKSYTRNIVTMPHYICSITTLPIAKGPG